MTANALSKKRRDNDSRARFLKIRGEIDAAISDGDCVEDMLRLAEIMQDVEWACADGITACDRLDPVLDKFEEGLGAYRGKLAAIKLKLEDSSVNLTS